MPCKHEGGSDKCVKLSNRECWAKHKHYRTNYVTGTKGEARGGSQGRKTAAAELLVCADLSGRGFEVTRPVSPTAIHDLHAEFPSVGWKGVQVKSARLNIRTNRLSLSTTNLKSPITALVFVPTKRVEYRGSTEPLPPELQE